MNPWLQFWEKSHRIYVSESHRRVHYRQVAADILSVLPGPDAVALDYGCGDALEAERIAAKAGRLLLFDAAQEVQGRLRQRFARNPRIEVVDGAALDALAPASIDLIVVNSVLQYLDRAETEALLGRAHRLLRAQGLLVIADVIPPDAGAVADTLSLLRTAAANGFLLAAGAGLLATFFSDYRQLRSQVGLQTFAPDAMLLLLRQAGFDAERRARNFGFNPRRMTFLARKPR